MPFGFSVNRGHGPLPNNADKRKAVSRLLADPEWGQWSDREIGRRCPGRSQSREPHAPISIWG
jgi:hypothetical protein